MKLMIQIQKNICFFQHLFSIGPWQAVGKELRVDFVGSYAQLLEQGRLTRLPRRKNAGRSGSGATEGEEMEEDGKREFLMGKLWENYRKCMETYGKPVKYGELWTNMAKLWTKLDIASSLVPWLAYKTWRFFVDFPLLCFTTREYSCEIWQK